jgi:hypothetical protein
VVGNLSISSHGSYISLKARVGSLRVSTRSEETMVDDERRDEVLIGVFAPEICGCESTCQVVVGCELEE